MSLHINEKAAKLIEMLEGDETGVLSDEYGYGRYAYDVAKKFLEHDGEIERLCEVLREVDDPTHCDQFAHELIQSIGRGEGERRRKWFISVMKILTPLAVTMVP